MCCGHSRCPLCAATATLNSEGWNVTPDVLAQGISLVNHLHPGVKRGGEETDPPV